MNLHVNEIKIEDQKVSVFTEEDKMEVAATGTMVVDSDHFQFVYLLDSAESYHNLRFVEDTWDMLKANKDKSWYLYGEIELTQFSEELNALLDNIVGNHNYGRPFVERVEKAFELE